jgi:ATP-dependent exoDNAse (exonuclease V) beta subunit
MKRKDYPSVTRILDATKPLEDKQALERWRQEVGEDEAKRISSEALKRGRKYDAMVQSHINGQRIPHRKLQAHLNSYKILASEETVYSDLYGYKGRFDCLFQHGNQVIINDFKGSGKKKKEQHIRDYFLQIAAYWQALTEMNIRPTYGMITIILEDDVQIFNINYEQANEYFQEFAARLEKYFQNN